MLYPFHLRDLLVRIAASGLAQAKWTAEILDESFRSILATDQISIPPAYNAHDR